MIDERSLSAVRRAYAKQVVSRAKATDPRIEHALATTPRENFLPSGPWHMTRRFGGYIRTPSADPRFVYEDVPVAIMPDRELNNGMPSFLTFLIALGRPRDGDHAVHVGAGLGYYTAIIGQLVAPSGRVTAIEHDPELAAAATRNLSYASNITVMQGDGSAAAIGPAEIIYVNAGASRPADTWLNALNPGGRLVLPLTVRYMTAEFNPMTKGAIFLIERTGDGFNARYMSPAYIYPCMGLRDEASERALAAAFKKDGINEVTRLRRDDDPSQEECWLRAPGWRLTYL